MKQDRAHLCNKRREEASLQCCGACAMFQISNHDSELSLACTGPVTAWSMCFNAHVYTYIHTYMVCSLTLAIVMWRSMMTLYGHPCIPKQLAGLDIYPSLNSNAWSQ